jgi:hypothetical protein
MPWRVRRSLWTSPRRHRCSCRRHLRPGPLLHPLAVLLLVLLLVRVRVVVVLLFLPRLLLLLGHV